MIKGKFINREINRLSGYNENDNIKNQIACTVRITLQPHFVVVICNNYEEEKLREIVTEIPVTIILKQAFSEF